MRLNSNPRPALARLGLLLAGLLGTAGAWAGSLSFQGQFITDDQLFVTRFVLAADEPLSATTLGYGGGTNLAGQDVAAGGFAPVLALFLDGFGLVDIARGSSHGCGAGAGQADPVSGFCWDATLGGVLPAGSYTLVLSQDGNEPLGIGLDDGYTRTGQPDFTGLDHLGQAGAMFIQVDGAPRTGHWALDLQAASVPEPLPWQLWLLGTALLALRRLPTGDRA